MVSYHLSLRVLRQLAESIDQVFVLFLSLQLLFQSTPLCPFPPPPFHTSVAHYTSRRLREGASHSHQDYTSVRNQAPERSMEPRLKPAQSTFQALAQCTDLDWLPLSWVQYGALSAGMPTHPPLRHTRQQGRRLHRDSAAHVEITTRHGYPCSALALNLQQCKPQGL